MARERVSCDLQTVAFPNSLSGAIELPGLNPEEVIRGIERALERERAPTDRQAQRLEFRVPFSRSGWNVLAPITNGVVEVATRGDNGVTVSYRVTFTRIVWFATVATGALAFLARAARRGLPERKPPAA